MWRETESEVDSNGQGCSTHPALHTSLANAGSGQGFTISAQFISVSLSCRSVVEANLNDLMCCYRFFSLDAVLTKRSISVNV